MTPPQPPTLPQESADIFSLSDQVLCDKLQFIEEASWKQKQSTIDVSFNSILADWFRELGECLVVSSKTKPPITIHRRWCQAPGTKNCCQIGASLIKDIYHCCSR
jgi:hypothetical protein